MELDRDIVAGSEEFELILIAAGFPSGPPATTLQPYLKKDFAIKLRRRLLANHLAHFSISPVLLDEFYLYLAAQLFAIHRPGQIASGGSLPSLPASSW